MYLIIPQIKNNFKFNLFPFIFEIKNFLQTIKEINSAYLFDSLAINTFEFNIIEIHMIIVYNKMSSKYSCFVRNQIENILNRYLIDYHLNIIQLCISDLPKNNDVSFLLKTKSIPFMISTNGIDVRNNIKNFTFNDFLNLNLFSKQKELLLKKTPKIDKEHYFLAKKFILGIYEKYFNYINKWLLSYYDIINELLILVKTKKINDKDKIILQKSISVLKKEYKFKPDDF